LVDVFVLIPGIVPVGDREYVHHQHVGTDKKEDEDDEKVGTKSATHHVRLIVGELTDGERRSAWNLLERHNACALVCRYCSTGVLSSFLSASVSPEIPASLDQHADQYLTIAPVTKPNQRLKARN
jgi:hypothetical protein